MVKFVVCFKHPADASAFETVYQNFLALCERIPELMRQQVVHVLGAPQGKANYYRILELYFSDQDTLQTALLTPQGQEAGSELTRFESGSLEIYYGDFYES